MAKLTEKQQRFIDYYIESGNASEAARRAGYKAKNADSTGRENLRKPTVKAAISARLKELEDARIAKVDEVLQFLTSTLRSEITEPHIVVEEHDDGCSEARVIDTGPSIRDRIEAAKSLLKRYPMDLEYTEKMLRIEKLKAELADLNADDDEEGIIFEFSRPKEEKAD